MAPKKAAKGGGGEEKDGATLDLENKMLAKRLEVLQYRLMVKDDAISGYVNDETAYKQKIEELDEGFKGESERSLENTLEMSRQFREMQSSFNTRIEDLQTQVSTSKSEIESVRAEIAKTAAEKDELIAQKDEEIRSLTLKMETMAFEFADMLKETLEKMSQRIEISHTRDATKAPLMNRLKEFSLSNGD